MKVSIKETKEFLANIQSVYKDTNKSYWEYQLAIEALEACEHQSKMLPSETHVVNDYEPPKVNDYEPTKVNDFEPTAEQKKEEEMIKEAKEVAKAYECFPRLKICGEQKKEEPNLDASKLKGKEKPVFYSKTFPPTIEERLDLLERYLGISKAKMKQTVSTLFVEQGSRLAKIEQRLTEIEGVLTSIGSPDYDLRKKVEELEKRIETIFQNTRENHADMFERVCGLEKRLRNY